MFEPLPRETFQYFHSSEMIQHLKQHQKSCLQKASLQNLLGQKIVQGYQKMSCLIEPHQKKCLDPSLSLFLNIFERRKIHRHAQTQPQEGSSLICQFVLLYDDKVELNIFQLHLPLKDLGNNHLHHIRNS